MKTFAWADTKSFGDKAATQVAAALKKLGHVVVDVTELPDARARGVDYLVDNEYIEIKADRHEAVNFYFEIDDNGKPGCFYNSRADAWLYYFPEQRRLYRVELPRATHHVSKNLTVYRTVTVTSKNRENVWQASGALVPIKTLEELGIAQDFSFILDKEASA